MTCFWLSGFLATHADLVPQGTIPLWLPELAAHTQGDPKKLCQALATHVQADDLLIGYSMGGRVALAAAAAGLPLKALLLLSTHPGLDDEAARAARRERDDQRAQQLRDDPARFVEAWRHEPIFAPARQQPRWQEQQQARLQAFGAGNADSQARANGWAAALSAFSLGRMPSVWPRLATLAVPTLWMAGALDKEYAALAQTAAARMPCARVEIVSGVGHVLPLEAAAQVNAQIEALRATPVSTHSPLGVVSC